MIKVEIPYYFEAGYKETKRHKAVNGVFGGTVDVEIESISSTDAPLVLEWFDTYWREKGNTLIHKFEDDFYDQYSKDGVEKTPENIVPDDIIRQRLSHAAPVAAPMDKLVHINAIYDQNSWEEEIDRVKQKAIEHAKNYIFIDGKLFRKTVLPNLLASVSYSMRDTSTDIRFGNSDYETGIHGMMFPISDFESALEWCKLRLALENQRKREEFRNEDVRNSLKIEVYRPDLLPAKDYTKAEVLRVAEFNMKKNLTFIELSDEAIDAWQICRARLVIAQENPEDQNIDALLDAWLDFYDAYETCESARCKSFGSTYEKETDIYYINLQVTLEIWGNRRFTINNDAESTAKSFSI